MTSNSEPLLEINNLSYTYRGNWFLDNIKALDGISLQVLGGESFGFLGHNGAGKTTCIKCILGLIRPRKGSVKLFGKSSSNLNARKLVGYLPEQPYFYDHLSVDELMMMYARLSGLKGRYRDVRSEIDRVLNLVKINHRRSSRLRTLSKGLIQRVGLAQAIIGKPKLLILDEPFSGLDPIGRREFRELFAQLKHEGAAIFLSSHILSDVEHLCDRVSIMAKGSIRQVLALNEKGLMEGGRWEVVVRNIEPIKSLLSESKVEFTTDNSVAGVSYKIDVVNRELGDRIAFKAIESGAGLESFNFIHARLEDLFVSVMQSAEVGSE